MNHNDNDSNKQIPQHDPSKPMDSKREVANSPDEKTDQDFPGYPHYPSKEDIMDKSTGSHRVDADLENMQTGSNASGVSRRYQGGNEADNRAEGETNETTYADTQETNDEIGVPQNLSNEDLGQNANRPGTDVQEAAEKGSTNP